MPKSPTSPPDDGHDGLRVPDMVARKKKNADAQAAFRQRRATYISSLEETVVKMEEVVLQLQTSCKEYQTTTDSLKQEVKRLKYEGRERERLWQAAWFNRASRGDDPPPLPESSLFGAVPVSPTVTQASPTMTQASNSYDERYNDGSMAYNNTSYNSSGYGPSSSSLAYATTPMDPRSQQAQQQQQQQYGPYMIATSGAHGSWQSSGGGGGSETIPPSTTPPTHSPTAYSDHRNPVMYNRFMDPSQSAAVESNTYMVEQSPTNSSPSTPISTTSAAPHGAHYNYGLMDTSDRGEGIYPRTNGHGHGHGIPMTLHGGLADVSASLSSRGYRPEVKLPQPPNPSTNTNPTYNTNTNPMSSPTHALMSPIQDFPPSTPAAPGHAGSNSSNKSHEQTPSRSPSPAADSQISQTLAVIKQQAFGTMRRTNRTRSKASSSNAAKAIEKLEARGVNLGLGRLPKRPRSDSDDEDGHM